MNYSRHLDGINWFAVTLLYEKKGQSITLFLQFMHVSSIRCVYIREVLRMDCLNMRKK